MATKTTMDAYDKIEEIKSEALGCCHPTRADMRRWGRALSEACRQTKFRDAQVQAWRLSAERRIAEVHGDDLAISLGE